MTNIFVSYSRRDKVFTEKLVNALQAANREVWADWASIPAASDWDAEIKEGIEQTESVLFVLSPEWVQSNECRKELNHALLMGKRLISILYQSIEYNDLPPELKKINWIDMSDPGRFEQGFGTVCTALDTDLDWVKTHRRIQVRALEWDKKNREPSFTLRGTDLTEGEQFLADTSNKSPSPTPLQSEYVLASRKQENIRQRNTLMGVTTALVVSIALGIVAFFQRQEAIRQEKEAINQAQISRASELAALGVSEKEKHFDLALLFAWEGVNKRDNSRTRSTLLELTDSHPGLLTFLSGHTETVTSIAFSPNGNIIATASSDGTILLWDVSKRDTPARLPPLFVQSNLYLPLAFSPDGRLLAAGSQDGTIMLWDLSNPTSPSELPPLTGHTGRLVTELHFSPDGRYIALADLMENFLLWDIGNSAAPVKIEAPVTGDRFAFSRQGSLFASAGREETIILWDMTNPAAPLPLPTQIQPRNGVENIVFSADGRNLAIQSSVGDISLLDVSDPAAPIQLPRFPEASPSSNIALSPDGTLLASGSTTNAVILWDIQDPANPSPLKLSGHSSSVTAVAFSPDGDRLASASIDGSIILWSTHDQTPPSQLARLPAQNVFAYSADGQHIAMAGDDGSISYLNVLEPSQLIQIAPPSDARHESLVVGEGTHIASNTPWNKRLTVWDLNEPGNPSVILINEFSSPIVAVAFSPDLQHLALGSDSGSISVWETSSSREIASIAAHGAYISKLVFSPDGKRLAAKSIDGQITVSDLSDPSNPVQLVSLDGPSRSIHELVFSPNGSHLAESDGFGYIHMWDLSNPPNSSEPPHKVSGSGVAFHPGGALMATGRGDGTIVLWNISNPAAIFQVAQIPGHTRFIFSMDFNMDGTLLASGSVDGSIILSDVSNSAAPFPIVKLAPDVGDVYTVAFSPDGKTLASQHSGDSFESTIILWDLDPESWKRKACQRAGRNFTLAEWAQYFPNEPYRKTCEQWPEAGTFAAQASVLNEQAAQAAIEAYDPGSVTQIPIAESQSATEESSTLIIDSFDP